MLAAGIFRNRTHIRGFKGMLLPLSERYLSVQGNEIYNPLKDPKDIGQKAKDGTVLQ